MVCRQTITAKVSYQKPVFVGSQSGNHRKSFTPELLESFAAKATPELVQSFAAKPISRPQSVRQSP